MILGLKQRVDYIVDELADCQKANGNGFVCAFDDGKRIFDEVGHGKIEVANGLNGGWVPWYTLHKDFAGLRDAYLYTGNEKAKTVMIGVRRLGLRPGRQARRRAVPRKCSAPSTAV